MGDIDARNFSRDTVEAFRESLASASFVSIDLEMTGISFPSKTENGNDSVPLRYRKIRQVAASFGVIQIGVSIFSKDESSAKVFNFYVFPRPVTEGSEVDSIPLVTLCSASTNFNRSHGMDFGRWIEHGITYVKAETEEKLREILFDEKALDKSWGRFLAGFSSLEASIREFEEYLSQERRVLAEVAQMSENSSYKVPFIHGGQKWLKSILASVRSKFPSVRLIEEVSGGGSSRVLTNKTFEDIFFDYIGFRAIWTVLTAACVPVVFHNGFLDLMFCYQHFEADLPETIAEFKSKVAHTFQGGVFDTRLIALESGISMAGSAALETLAEIVKSNVVTVNDSGKYSDASGKFHEAGFDALLTGKVFLGLKSKLSDINQWKNHICISRCLWVLSIDTLDSDRVLLDCGVGKIRIIRVVSEMTKSVSTRDVLGIFEDVKSITPATAVNIQWINDTSGILLVTWSGEKASDSVSSSISLKIAECAKTANFKLSTPAEFVKQQLEEITPDPYMKRFRL